MGWKPRVIDLSRRELIGHISVLSARSMGLLHRTGRRMRWPLWVANGIVLEVLIRSLESPINGLARRKPKTPTSAKEQIEEQVVAWGEREQALTVISHDAAVARLRH